MPSAPAPPPAYAWDWVGRQRLVWREARQRLVPADPAVRGRPSDVPDWSELLHRGPVRSPSTLGVTPTSAVAWHALATRAEVMAALRVSYPVDAAVRSAVDGSVRDIAFLGRSGGDLDVLGVRTPPRGLRWWWNHLGGTSSAGAGPAALSGSAGRQLTLTDVMTGYGDPAPAV